MENSLPHQHWVLLQESSPSGAAPVCCAVCVRTLKSWKHAKCSPTFENHPLFWRDGSVCYVRIAKKGATLALITRKRVNHLTVFLYFG